MIAGPVLLLGLFGMVLAAGFAWFLRRSRLGTLAVLATAAALMWWSGHYLRSLVGASTLTHEQEWHRLYMIWLLIAVPTALLLGGLVGFVLRQREYLAQYPGIEA